MKLKSPEIRSAIVSFVDEAVKCYVESPKGIDFNRIRMIEGVLFELSDVVREKQNYAVNRIIKALGPVKGHFSDIDPLLWQFVVRSLHMEQVSVDNSAIDDLLDKITENAATSVQLIKPCHNIVLLDKTNNVQIGPVKIRRSEKALADLRRNCLSSKIEIGDGDDIFINGNDITLTKYIWQVQVSAATKVRQEQVAWLVDIAISLLRFGVKRNNLGIHPPSLEKLEALPFSRVSPDHNLITIGPNQRYSLGGWTLPCTYQLGVPAQRELLKGNFKRKADVVFLGASKSLAERFAQGLGWMSRGRQSTDRPTRLLYFFTAIESLLSDSDKTAPVVQTVARHAAVLLNDDNTKRVLISKTIRQLYGLRSSLVHTGTRGVFDEDSNTIQLIAELLFQKVWDDIDLSIKHARFVDALATASYGLRPIF